MPKPLFHLKKEKRPKAPIIDIGGVWKKCYKNPKARNRGYPDDIQCCKCGNYIPDYGLVLFQESRKQQSKN